MKTLHINSGKEITSINGIELLSLAEMFQIRGGDFDNDKTGTKEEDVYPTKED